MKQKRFKPLVDKLFWIVFIPVALLTLALIMISIYSLLSLIISVVIAVVIIYLLVSPLFGYVELRDNSVYIKFGFVLKKEIPYDRIRGVIKERKSYSDSIISLKNAFEHVNIKYNTFDVVTVSVVGNDAFIKELEERIASK